MSISLDLSPLGATRQAVRAEYLPDPDVPWLTTPVRERPRPDAVLRLIQCVRAWKEAPLEEMENTCTELARHFDIAECFFAYEDWRYADPEASRTAALARRIQNWIDAGHRAGLEMALSLSWSTPLSGARDTSMPEEFWGETFDPVTGEFRKTERWLDWGNRRAREAAFSAMHDVASQLKGVDYLFFNEPHFDVSTWYEVPLFSEAALADFRRFAGDPAIRFPAKAYAAETPRTDNEATQRHWRLWHDWINGLYVTRIQGEARAVARANATNPRYGGAIWFQASMWHGDDFGVDLDRVCAIPELTYIVCEYATSADHPGYRTFRYFADRHDKRFGTFVNVGRYDASHPGSVRYEGTVEDTRRATHFGLEEHADMIAAYPMSSFLPWSEAFSPQRVAIWDDEMRSISRAGANTP